MKEQRKFNVMQFDFNRSKLDFYDVLPYFRREYNECQKDKRPKTREEWVEFVNRKGRYQFWSNAVYEFQISSWPPYRDIEKFMKEHEKVDAWQQIEANLDVVVDLLMREYKDV